MSPRKYRSHLIWLLVSVLAITVSMLAFPLTAGANGAANLSGTVFNDANSNGIIDSGEAGISGATVNLKSGSIVIDTQTTNASGYYIFSVAPGSGYIIESIGPGGYHSTTPQSLSVTPPTAGDFPDNNFGYATSSAAASIYGIVFVDDYITNGIQDMFEDGVNGVTISLFKDSTKLDEESTGLAGTYGFSVSSTGIYNLQMDTPVGYNTTTSASININVAALSQSYYCDFGIILAPPDSSPPASSTPAIVVGGDVYGIDKWGLLMPWIILSLALVAVTFWLLHRRLSRN